MMTRPSHTGTYSRWIKGPIAGVRCAHGVAHLFWAADCCSPHRTSFHPVVQVVLGVNVGD